MKNGLTYIAEYTLPETSHRRTVPELKGMALTLGFAFKPGVRKQRIVETVAQLMPGKPEKLRPLIPAELERREKYSPIQPLLR